MGFELFNTEQSKRSTTFNIPICDLKRKYILYMLWKLFIVNRLFNIVYVIFT